MTAALAIVVAGSIDQGAIIRDKVSPTPHFLVCDSYFVRGSRFAPEPIWPLLPAVSSLRLRPMKLGGRRRRWQERHKLGHYFLPENQQRTVAEISDKSNACSTRTAKTRIGESGNWRGIDRAELSAANAQDVHNSKTINQRIEPATCCRECTGSANFADPVPF